MRQVLLDAESLTEERLRNLTADEFDALPFGAIKLDAEGRVTGYNAVEANLARRSQQATMGRRFFEDIAPCTNVAGFRGKLDALIGQGRGTESFDFRFLFSWGTRDVRIRLMVLQDGSRWVFVTALPQR
ncbi:MAG TPA: PAS domain-containing protein [Myxococcaceae bacterium]|nr:PAS domain-containing protein [Myxococcaceae bacterium]